MEAQMVEHYKALIQQWPDEPIAVDARFELAETMAWREQYEAAVPVLKEAIAKPVRDEIRDKIVLLLGVCLSEQGQFGEAIPHLEQIAQNAAGPLAPYAAFRAGEAYLATKALDKALAKFQLFLDQAAYQQIEGLSDRGLLRLAYTQSQMGQHEASQKTCEAFVARFPKSPLLAEAQFTLGQAFQGQKQFDAAVKAYGAVITTTTSETAARAQFEIGMCQVTKQLYNLAVNEYLKVVYTYNYPHWSAAALCQAADAAAAGERYDDAKKYLKRVIDEFAATEFLPVAKQRLGLIESKGK
jgi:TolA-binding protein